MPDNSDTREYSSAARLILPAVIVLVVGGFLVKDRIGPMREAARKPAARDNNRDNNAAETTSAPADTTRAWAEGELVEPDDVLQWWTVEDFRIEIAQLPTVFWDPADTESLRQLIRETPLVHDKRVLEIGTGTGLVALCCLQAGAEHVVATDVNPAALANARFNAQRLGLHNRLELRLVSPANPLAYSTLRADEKFDIVISNPPWEDAHPERIEDMALYDEQFRLLDSLLAGCREHLTPPGRLLLAYGHVPAIRRLLQQAPHYQLDTLIRDSRELTSLPENFRPGMLIEIRPLVERSSGVPAED